MRLRTFLRVAFQERFKGYSGAFQSVSGASKGVSISFKGAHRHSSYRLYQERLKGVLRGVRSVWWHFRGASRGFQGFFGAFYTFFKRHQKHFKSVVSKGLLRFQRRFESFRNASISFRVFSGHLK